MVLFLALDLVFPVMLSLKNVYILAQSAILRCNEQVTSIFYSLIFRYFEASILNLYLIAQLCYVIMKIVNLNVPFL